MKGFYILLVGLLLSGIFIFTINNISYAWSFDEFTEFCQETLELQPTNSKRYMSYIINNKSGILSYLSTAGINIDNYNTFFVSNYGNYKVRFMMYNVNDNTAITITNSSIKIQNGGGGYYIYMTANNNYYTYSTLSSNITEEYIASGLLGKEPYNNYYGNCIYQNYYNYFNLLGAENRDVSLLPWYFGDARIGIKYNNSNLNYFDLFTSGDTYVMHLNAENMTEVNGGKLYQLEIPFTSGIINGDFYKIKYSNNDTYFYTTNIFKISWYQEPVPGENTGQIINNSGDVTSYIDLSGVTLGIDKLDNSINNQTHIIISGDKAIENAIIASESGDIQRDNFWKNIYNNLFTLNSGDVNDIYLLTTQYFPSGDYSPLGFFDKLFGFGEDNEPEDFIISWDDVYLGATSSGDLLYNDVFIHGSSINFSELCRDNDTFGIILSWVRVLSSLAVFIMYLFGFYYGVLDILGVLHPDDFIKDEEKTVIGFSMDR